jgi:hypothetical protein
MCSCFSLLLPFSSPFFFFLAFITIKTDFSISVFWNTSGTETFFLFFQYYQNLTKSLTI